MGTAWFDKELHDLLVAAEKQMFEATVRIFEERLHFPDGDKLHEKINGLDLFLLDMIKECKDRISKERSGK